MAEIRQIERRSFTIEDPEEAGRIVRGRMALPEGTEKEGNELPCVLILHGFKGFMDWGFFPELATRLVLRGIAAVSFNFSGSGVGEDPCEISEDEAFFNNTPSREVEDVGRVRAWIEARGLSGIDPARCAIFGHSLGGAVAFLHAAVRRDYRAVVVWAPIGDFARRRGDVAKWREQGYSEITNGRTGQVHRLGVGWLNDVENNASALDISKACGRLSTPTLICHGREDEAVPLEEVETLYRAFQPDVAHFLAIADTGHTFGAKHPLTEVGADLETVLSETVETFATHLL